MVVEDMEIMLTALGGNANALKGINPERVYGTGQ
jgi:hypothetical protein